MVRRAALHAVGLQAMLRDVQTNPSNMNKYLANDTFQLVGACALCCDGIYCLCAH